MNTSFIPVDNDARQAIRNGMITSTLLVEAGAGTGKTTLLIDRIMALLQSFDITQIVAITFTEKAALELQDRLRQALESKVAAHSPTDRRLLDALHRLDRANISTIHAFASSLLHEIPVEVGLDPEFSHIEPAEETALIKQLLANQLNNASSKVNSLVREHKVLGGKIDNVVTLFDKVYEDRDLLADLSFSLTGVNPVTEFSTIRNRLEQLLQLSMNSCSNQADSLLLPLKKLFIQISAALSELDQLRAIGNFKGINTAKKGNKGNWHSADDLNYARSELGTISTNLLELQSLVKRDNLHGLLNWINELCVLADKLKRAEGLVSFQDQLLLAVKLVKDSDVVNLFRYKYHRLLIDEFQDTDPLQVELALSLAANKQEVADLFQTELEPGKLCIIGDPKQSIYRFRRADPLLYEAVSGQIIRSGNKINITQNFRSAPGIINFVNRFFEFTWPTVDSSQYVSIEPLARPDLQPTPSVKVIRSGDGLPENSKIFVVRQFEAHALVGQISDAADNWQVTAKQPDGTLSPRPATYSDITILFPTTTDIGLLTSQLTDHSIPFVVEGGKGFYLQQIVIDLYNIICAIDNPLDSYSIFGAFRSRLFGVKDRDLAHYHQFQPNFDYRTECTGISDDLHHAQDILRKYYIKKNTVSSDLLLERLIEELEVFPAFRSLKNCESDLRAIEIVLQLVRTYSAQPGKSWRGFKRWFAERMESKDEKHTIQSGSGDVVHLMTIHNAKGLEFPIVMLWNLNSARDGSHSDSVKVVPDRINRKLHVGIGAKDNRFATEGFDTAWEQEEAIQEAENLRLLYVAMTRARDHLVIPSFYSEEPKGFAGWIASFLESETVSQSIPNYYSITEVATPETVQPDNDHGLQTGINVSLQLDYDNVQAQLSTWESDRKRRLSEAVIRLPMVHRPSSHSAVTISDSQGEPSAEFHTAGLLGNIVHKYLSICPLNAETDIDLVHRIVNGKNGLIPEVIPLIENCVSSEIWTQAVKSGVIWREVPVVLFRDKTFTRGSIDLVWQDDKGNVKICDWKTGAKNYDRHSHQLREYAKLLEATTQVQVARSYIYYARDAQLVDVEI